MHAAGAASDVIEAGNAQGGRSAQNREGWAMAEPWNCTVWREELELVGRGEVRWVSIK